MQHIKIRSSQINVNEDNEIFIIDLTFIYNNQILRFLKYVPMANLTVIEPCIYANDKENWIAKAKEIIESGDVKQATKHFNACKFGFNVPPVSTAYWDDLSWLYYIVGENK